MLREQGVKFVLSSLVGNRPQGIIKRRPIRKSTRLQTQTVSKVNHIKRIEAIRSLISNATISRKVSSSITF